MIAFALLLMSVAHAAVLQVGTYSGTDAKRVSFNLHVQEVPGRTGSFMGILMNKTQARIYLLDQFSNGKYGMVALRPLENYVIGAISSTPIMALTVTDDSIVVSPNHTSVDMSFNTSITFKNRKKALNWSELQSGNYASKKMVVSSLDGNNEATVTSKVANITGDFVLRESRKDLFVMLASQLNPTGVKLSKDVSTLVFFQKKSMILINASSGAYTTLK